MAAFALFVASKDPKEWYNWRNCHECAVGQYLRSIGQVPDIGRWTGVLDEMNMLALGAHRSEVYGSAICYEPGDWTFGALADRIFAYQSAA